LGAPFDLLGNLMKIPTKEKTQPVDLGPISGVNRATVKETDMSWNTLDRMQLMGKRVLTRVDINVPVENGRVTDTTRIDRIVPTVQHILKRRRHAHPDCPFWAPQGAGSRSALFESHCASARGGPRGSCEISPA
jgi:hypothetical protein